MEKLNPENPDNPDTYVPDSVCNPENFHMILTLMTLHWSTIMTLTDPEPVKFPEVYNLDILTSVILSSSPQSTILTHNPDPDCSSPVCDPAHNPDNLDIQI